MDIAQVVETNNNLHVTADVNQYLTFLLAGEEYGVDILRVQEIKGWDKVTPIPNTPGYVKGVMNLRGTIVPIIDLRQRFGFNDIAYSPMTVVIVLKVIGERERIMGIVVDGVSDVYNVAKNDLQPPPDFGDVDIEYVHALATVDNKMVIVLDIDILLNKLDELAEEKLVAPHMIAKTHNAAPSSGYDKTDSINDYDVALLETSYAALSAKADELVERFYAELFRRHPDIGSLFENGSMTEQRKKFIAALDTVMANLRNTEYLENLLSELGRKHKSLGVTAAHYAAITDTLLNVMAGIAGDLWSERVASAWQNAIKRISYLMQQAT